MSTNDFVFWFSVGVAIVVVICAYLIVQKYNNIGRE